MVMVIFSFDIIMMLITITIMDMKVQIRIRMGKRTGSGMPIIMSIKTGRVNQNKHGMEIIIRNHDANFDWTGNMNRN